MPTILRVKRRYDEETVEAFIVACKKQKLESTNDSETVESNPFTTIVKFAGTVQNQEDNVVEHLAKTLTKDQLTMNYKQHVADIENKIRTKVKEVSRENRYKVVNSFRSMGTFNIEEIDDKNMTVIDVEDSISCSTKKSINNKDTDAYVYDLYYTQTEEDIKPDNYFSIQPFEQELVFDNYRDTGINSDHDESEDSNSESNWRNDYPDSDHSENSINDDDIQAAVERLKIDGDESDLSSENSDFIYSVDEADVDNFGYKYARYKAKLEKELQVGASDDDEDDIYGVRITEITDDHDENNDDDDDSDINDVSCYYNEEDNDD